MPQLHGVVLGVLDVCQSCCGVVLVLMVIWMCATATWCSACVDGLLDVCHSYMV